MDDAEICVCNAGWSFVTTTMARPRHVHERNKLRRCSIVAVLTTVAENMNIATDTRPADAAVEEKIWRSHPQTKGRPADAQDLDIVGWLARDPNVLRRVGHVLLQLPYTVSRSPRQIVIADDCFQEVKIPVDRIVQVVIKSTEKLFGKQVLKHENIGEYCNSKVPSLKKISRPEEASSLKLLANVVQFLQRHEFRHNHGEWIDSVKPVLESATSAQHCVLLG
ncbi:hypothetical protein ACFX13_018925 [Malus domestica]